jgi:small subunit ribosomal protein S16
LRNNHSKKGDPWQVKGHPFVLTQSVFSGRIVKPSNSNYLTNFYIYYMLTIRLQRAGKKHQTLFRVVLADKTAAASKKFQEVLASYNPHTKELVVKDQERLNYWIGQKVALSPTVHNLFVSQNIISEPKIKAFSIPKKPVEAAAPEAPAAPAQEAPAETPTEDAPAEAPAEAAEAPVEETSPVEESK